MIFIVIMNSFFSILDKFQEFPTAVKVVWLFSTFFLFVIVVLIIYLKILRTSLRKNEALKLIYSSEYEADLIAYLYADNVEGEENSERLAIIEKMKSQASNKFKRRIIVSTLVKLRNEISGEMSEAIKELYVKSGLIHFAKTKLSHKKWFIIAIGIKELTEFHIEEVYNDVLLLLNHPKKEVRTSVQLYLVNLFHFKGLDFLNELESPLSEWDQIQVLEILQKFDDQQIPDVTNWLKSSNDSIVLFALKLSKIYNQFEIIEELHNLLTHKNLHIRLATIQLLGYFQVPTIKGIIKPKFNDISEEEQMAFFEVLEIVYSEDDEPFVLENVNNEHFEIKVTALKILKAININKFNELKQEAENPDDIRIMEFINNN